MDRMVAPALIPGTRSEMNTPGFWIGMHPFPDKVVLNGDGIREFNEAIRNDLKITHDLASYPSTAAGKDLQAALLRDLTSLSGRKLYLSGGKPVNHAVLKPIEQNMGLTGIPREIKVRYGFVVKSAEQRRLPTAERFYPGMIGREFDMLQELVLDIGVPLAILHTSGDGKWHYVVAPHCEGWIADDHLAGCTLAAMRYYLKNTECIVVTSVRGDIYLDPTLTAYYDRVKMGARLPMVKEHGSSAVEITIPRRNKEDFHYIARRALEHLDHENCETACYRCLKSYANQRFHELLNWPLAVPSLEALAGAAPEQRPPGLGDIDDPGPWLEAYAAGVGSPLELKFLRLFERHGFKPARQVPLSARDGAPPISVADFAVPERRLAIYIDGASYHAGANLRRDRHIRDRLRDGAPPWRVVELRAKDLAEGRELVERLMI